MARGDRPTDPEIQISPEAVEAGERVHPLVADVVIKIDEALTEVEAMVQKYSALPAEKKNLNEQKAETDAQQLRTKALLAKAELHLLAGDLIGPGEVTADMVATVKAMAPIYSQQGQERFMLPAAEMNDVFVPSTQELESLAKVETIRILATQEYLQLQKGLDNIKRTERGGYPQKGDGYDSSGNYLITKVDMTGIAGQMPNTAYAQNVYNNEHWFGNHGGASVMGKILNEKPPLLVFTKGQPGKRGDVVIGSYTGYTDAFNRQGYSQVEIPPLDAQTTLHVAHLERIKAKFQGIVYDPKYSSENHRLQIDPESGVEYVKGSNKAEETKNKADAASDYARVEEKFRAMVEKDLGANEPLTEPELRKRHKKTKETLAGKESALAETTGALEQTRTKEAEARAEVERLGAEVRRLSEAQRASEAAQAASNREIANLRTDVSALTAKQTATESTNATNLEVARTQARFAAENAERERSNQELQRVQAENQRQLEKIQAILASAGAFNKGDKIKEVLALLGQ